MGIEGQAKFGENPQETKEDEIITQQKDLGEDDIRLEPDSESKKERSRGSRNLIPFEVVWTEDRIIQELDQLFQQWKQEDESSRPPFSPQYINTHNRNLYFAIHKRKVGFTAYLPSEAIVFWSQQNRSVSGLDKKLLPQVNPLNSRYIDENGRKWVSGNAVTREYKRYFDPIKWKVIVTWIPGRDTKNRETVLYAEDEVELKFKSYADLKFIDESTGEWTDEEGEVRVAINENTVRNKDISRQTLNRFLDEGKYDFKYARNSKDRVKTYRKKDVELVMDDFLVKRAVDKETGIYKDESGEEWIVYQKAIVNAQKIDPDFTREILQDFMAGVRIIPGRDSVKKPVNLYNKNELEEKINKVLAYPKIDRATGKYTDSQGQVWATLETISKETKLSSSYAEVNLKSIPSLWVRGKEGNGKKGGGITNVYNLEKA